MPASNQHNLSAKLKRRRAFTLVELIIGMAITLTAVTAMGGFMSAVSQAWKQQGVSQTTALGNRLDVMRVQKLLRPAKLVGLTRAGSISSAGTTNACVLFWAADNLNGSSDRICQFGEIALIEHDRASNSLKYYHVVFPATWSAAQITAANTKSYSYADLTSSTAPEDFKALNYVTSQVLATNITGATFAVNNPTGTASQLPSVDFQLAITRGSSTSGICGSVALRTPDYKPTQ